MLHKTVWEMLNQMTSKELTQWNIWLSIKDEPPPPVKLAPQETIKAMKGMLGGGKKK